jgi:CBS domain containing-hemolysin-like protein
MDTQIAIIGISMLFSAFFSGMEIAYVSSNKFQVELEKKKEGFMSRILGKLTSKSSKFITTMLVGNVISLVIYSFFMGDYLVGLLPLEGLNQISVLFIHATISTLVILVTSEFLPKAIFRIYANEMLWFFAPLAYLFYLVFHYLSDLLTALSNFILKLVFNIDKDVHQTAFSKEELGNYITEQLEQARDQEEFDSEIQIFQNALEFDTVMAREIMVPRTELFAVSISDPIDQLRKLFIDTGYSKIIVYKDSLDDILGYAHVFELFKKPRTVRSILLPVEFVPESMSINTVLNLLTRKKRSVAVVLDEYGGTAGIITVEDIVEELFGEIVDEHDTLELTERKISDKEFELSARHEVDYINETFNLDIPTHEAYESLGGYIVYHNEDIPKQDEVLRIGPLEFTMLKVESKKIVEVHLKVLDDQD